MVRLKVRGRRAATGFCASSTATTESPCCPGEQRIIQTELNHTDTRSKEPRMLVGGSRWNPFLPLHKTRLSWIRVGRGSGLVEDWWSLNCLDSQAETQLIRRWLVASGIQFRTSDAASWANIPADGGCRLPSPIEEGSGSKPSQPAAGVLALADDSFRIEEKLDKKLSCQIIARSQHARNRLRLTFSAKCGCRRSHP